MRLLEVVRVGKNGRIILPPIVLKLLQLRFDEDGRTYIEFQKHNEKIILAPFKPVCIITNEATDDVVEILPNIFLSRKGMEVLEKELKIFLNN